MNKVDSLTVFVCSKLTVLGIDFTVHKSKRSSYIKVKNCGRIKMVRVSDHQGHKLPRSVVQLRTDRVTQRKARIYSHLDKRRLIDAIFKERLKFKEL